MRRNGEFFMKINIKEKLTGKSAYIILVLLMATVLILSVISIVSAVQSNDTATPPPDISGEQNNVTPTPENGGSSTPEQPSDTTPDDTTDQNVPSAPTDQQETVYGAPCNGTVQKDYSEDVLVFSQTMKDHRIHLGIDISGKLGDAVKAVANGTVEKIFSDPFMGQTVVIDHGNGLRSYYMNLSATIPEQIKEGVSVKKGDVIGAIGETAIVECADEPHLHFEIRIDGNKVNPNNYITVPSSSDTDSPEYEG